MTTSITPPDTDLSSETSSAKQSMFAGVSPKLTFIMGIVSGVAAVSLAGFVLAVSYGLSGNIPNSLWGLVRPQQQLVHLYLINPQDRQLMSLLP